MYIKQQCGGSSFILPPYYTLKNIIGSGAYGVVCSGVDSRTTKSIAIKKSRNVFKDAGDGKRILREIKLLTFLKHRNIIPLVNLIVPEDPQTFEDVYLIFQLMSCDLKRLINSSSQLTQDHIRFIMFQILHALSYLHSCNIIHRDLKPENVFLNKDCTLKLGDFNLARRLQDDDEDFTDDSIVQGSVSAVYDLLHEGDRHLVCRVHFRVAAGKDNPVQGREPSRPNLKDHSSARNSNQIRYFQKCFMAKLPQRQRTDFASIFPKASSLAIDLLDKMLVYNPQTRLTADKALEHQYFDKVRHKLQVTRGESPQSWQFEKMELTISELRRLIFGETAKFRQCTRAQ